MKLFWSCGLALWMLGAVARADGEWTVLDLRLAPDPAWSRGTPEQEREDEALVLSWPAGGATVLQALVPRDPPLVKSGSGDFYRNLGRKWRAQHGKDAQVGWYATAGEKDTAGHRWLVCRRPARDGQGVVFHLARVHEGRAYSLLLFAPPGTGALPPAARALLAAASFRTPAPWWRQTRAVAVLPRGEALAALAQAESETLGERGMLTDYRLQALAGDQGPGIAWILEGFHWTRRLGRDERLPFVHRGEFLLQGPAALEGTARLRLKLEPGAPPMTVRARLGRYCGPAGPWREALAALDRGARGPLARLGRDHGCAGDDPPGGETSREVRGGEDWTHGLELALPRSPDGLGPRWLEVALSPAPGAVGEGLLGRVALVLVYEAD